jgi:hypothetical protein
MVERLLDGKIVDDWGIQHFSAPPTISGAEDAPSLAGIAMPRERIPVRPVPAIVRRRRVSGAAPEYEG